MLLIIALAIFIFAIIWGFILLGRFWPAIIAIALLFAFFQALYELPLAALSFSISVMMGILYLTKENKIFNYISVAALILMLVVILFDFYSYRSTEPYPRYETVGDAVHDKTTRLQWMKKYISYKEYPTAEEGGKLRYTYQKANAACRSMRINGNRDWRIPTKKEISSIILRDRPPAYDTTYFEGYTEETDLYGPAHFWTTSTCGECFEKTPWNCRWTVEFNPHWLFISQFSESVHWWCIGLDKYEKQSVVCVRGPVKK